MAIDSAGMSRKEIEFIHDGGLFKRLKDVYHHGPRPIPGICHLSEPLLSHYLSAIKITCPILMDQNLLEILSHLLLNWNLNYFAQGNSNKNENNEQQRNVSKTSFLISIIDYEIRSFLAIVLDFSLS